MRIGVILSVLYDWFFAEIIVIVFLAFYWFCFRGRCLVIVVRFVVFCFFLRGFVCGLRFSFRLGLVLEGVAYVFLE